MNNKEEIHRANLTQWQVESLRMTAFPSHGSLVNPEGWWRSVCAQEPETQVIRAQIGERQEQGTYQGAILTLRAQQIRVDWTFTPVAPEPESRIGFLTIGQFEETCTRFSELMQRWIPLSPPLSRIAFGVIALLPVSGHAEGYERLASYLPAVKLDAEGSSEFLYRINRRRLSKSGIKDLQINRLSTWSLLRAEYRAVSLDSGAALQVVQGEPIFACRVELDVNTIAGFNGILIPDQSLIVFRELVDLARESVRDGDRP